MLRIILKNLVNCAPGCELFDFLAECIDDFVSKHSLAGQRLPLGFTFSFPMIQTALNVGNLVTWTKSFNCAGVVGTDAVQQLNSAIVRRGGNLAKDIEVVVILNDTTGTLIKGAYDDPKTSIGLILGTGCNAAYLEKKANVSRWGTTAQLSSNCTEVVIDTEMGAFGDNGCIDFVKTEFDRKVDEESLLPNSFSFEKYFAGKYIGDLLRHILLGLHGQQLFCKGQKMDVLGEQGSITSTDISDIEGDDNSAAASRVTQRLGLLSSKDDNDILRYVCSLLAHRCALLVGVTMAALLSRAERADASIAVTGSLYKCHPNLKDLLERYTRKYYDKWEGKTFLSDDGSGKGAGLLAAIADRINKT
jgi:hexokinase